MALSTLLEATPTGGALVTMLPTAARAPVEQNRRRGRLPRAVPSLPAVRRERDAKVKESQDELVRACEELLDLARAGGLQGLIFIAQLPAARRESLVALGPDFRLGCKHKLPAIEEVMREMHGRVSALIAEER